MTPLDLSIKGAIEEFDQGAAVNPIQQAIEACEWVQLVFTDDTMAQERDPELWMPKMGEALTSLRSLQKEVEGAGLPEPDLYTWGATNPNAYSQSEQAIEALALILPMAKGYAHQHPVGNNSAFCDQAEAALSALQSLQGVELPKPAATLHDDGYWTPQGTEEGRNLNSRLARAGTREGVYTADQLRTAVAAALGRGAMPQGWKLVPMEPTPEMRKAAADAWLDCDSKLFLNKAGAAVRAAIAISKESA